MRNVRVPVVYLCTLVSTLAWAQDLASLERAGASRCVHAVLRALAAEHCRAMCETGSAGLSGLRTGSAASEAQLAVGRWG